MRTTSFCRVFAPCVLVFLAGAAAAGPMEPAPGPVAPTFKTLQQIEPRIPISTQTTPGDATSSFRITQPGSYYLDGDLMCEAGKIGIRVEASNVSIDLNGFSMVGNGGTTAIADHGNEQLPDIEHLTVRNGTIRDFSNGVFSYLCRSFHLTELTVIGGSYAMGLNGSAAIESCHVLNAQYAFEIQGAGTTLRNCTVVGGQVGFGVTGATMENCAVSSAQRGIRLGGSVARGCTATACSTVGVELQGDAQVIEGQVSDSTVGVLVSGHRCAVRSMNISAMSSNGIEIELGSFGTSVIGNTMTGCAGAGIFVDKFSTSIIIKDNVTTDHKYGIWVDGTNNVVTGNIAGAHTSGGFNYRIVAANRFGPIVRALSNASLVNVTSSSGDVAGTITSDQTFANISY